MNIKPIKNEQDYTDTLSKIESLMSAKPNTPQMDELEVLLEPEYDDLLVLSFRNSVGGLYVR